MLLTQCRVLCASQGRDVKGGSAREEKQPCQLLPWGLCEPGVPGLRTHLPLAGRLLGQLEEAGQVLPHQVLTGALSEDQPVDVEEEGLEVDGAAVRPVARGKGAASPPGDGGVKSGDPPPQGPHWPLRQAACMRLSHVGDAKAPSHHTWLPCWSWGSKLWGSYGEAPRPRV